MANKKTQEPFSWTVPLAVAGVIVAIAATLFCWPRSPAQLGFDEELFGTVDALFTAVTSQDAGRLEACEKRLQTLQQQGRMSEQAAAVLAAPIQQARSGQWDSAAKQLYRIMLGQRRE